MTFETISCKIFDTCCINIKHKMGFVKDLTTVKNCIRYIVTFLFVVILLTGLLVLVALIPQNAIRGNVRESAEYLCEGELFGMAVDGVKGSEIDRYADSILLAIAYQYDASQPLKSVMWSSYYYTPYENENENLLHAVTEGKKANRQYLRYWHGSNTVVRPLLVFFSLKQIYRVNGIILAALGLFLMTLLVKNKAYGPAIGVLAGLIMTSSWFVPLSLEYTFTCLLMLVISIVGVKLTLQGKEKHLGILFMVGGMVCAYMDFLTTETLSLTVPLLLVLWVFFHKNSQVSRTQVLKEASKITIAWGFGYVGMWVMKWVMASLILGENVMPYVTGHIGERLYGDIGVGLLTYIRGAITRNIGCLFPLEYGEIGVLFSIFLVLFAFYTGYVYHGKHICGWHILMYMLPGLVPYIRYLVLHNHSYLHCFFTYRAQMATVLAIVLIVEEVVDWRWLADGGK